LVVETPAKVKTPANTENADKPEEPDVADKPEKVIKEVFCLDNFGEEIAPPSSNGKTIIDNENEKAQSVITAVSDEEENGD
jgi:hypothetical protein